MGGGLSLALATQLASTPHPLLAAVTCYGTPPKDLFDVREITKVTPVQGHFGDKVRLQLLAMASIIKTHPKRKCNHPGRLYRI
jgi:hypothetical protein